jgi:hypothetical protein
MIRLPRRWRPQLGLALCALGLAALGLVGMSPPAQAHPHGTITCSAQLSFEQDKLRLIRLRLEIDAGNSERILMNQLFDEQTGEPQGPRALMLKNLVARAFREQDWLLSLKQGPSQALVPIALAEQSPMWVKRTPAGRLALGLDLAPSTPIAPSHSASASPEYFVTCQDPSWFWVASFSDAQSLQVQGAPCRAQALTDELKMPDNSQALQTRFRIECAAP